MANCRYCNMIEESSPGYRVKKANRDLSGDFPRCSWHWQFVCSRCGRSVSFNGTAWCNEFREFYCIKCAPRHRREKSEFWAWSYYYEIWCEKCGAYHKSLDRLEFEGKHPWQRNGSARRARLGLSGKKEIEKWGWIRWAPRELEHPSLHQLEDRWNNAADIWDATYGKYGDSYRRNIFNPALFPMFGNVKGKRILDAGCGAGYLSRWLAERGAEVTGVDLSKRFIELAREYERKKPLGIRYERANLANLSGFVSASFDMAVSVYVLCDTRDCQKAIHEIARVLKPGARFVCLISHPCFSWETGAWEHVPEDSERTEDWRYFKVDHYFKRRTLESQWGKLPVLLSFRRPLSDYFHFLKKGGFLVRDLVEPRPRRKVLKERPREWDKEERIPPVLIIEAVKS